MNQTVTDWTVLVQQIIFYLVNLDSCVNLLDEKIGSVEADGSSQQPGSEIVFKIGLVVDGWMGLPECNNHYESVGEVEKCWDKFIDL